MPVYTPTTPTLTLCDSLVSVINTAWAPADPSGVERQYFRRFADTEDERLKLSGRRVVIFPTHYAYDGFTRGEDEYRHEISILTVERFEGQGDPPRDWIDARVDFVYAEIVQRLDYSYGGQASFNRKLVTESIEIQVCDLEKLVGSGRLFYSLVNFVFLELI